MTLTTHGRQAVQPHWPEELYARVVKESLVRPVLVNHARVEPELGSPARGGLPATRARRTGDGWAISGTKRFVTGAEGLDWFLVWATTDEPEPRVGTFLVPGDSPGIEVTGRWDQLGLRASGSHDVTFRDVEVAYEDVIGLAPYGPAAEQDNRAGASIHLPLAALYLGVARAAQDFFHTFAQTRVPANLGHPVARTERFRRTAGEIEVLLDGAEQLVFGGAARVDATDPSYTPEQALGARVLADRHGCGPSGWPYGCSEIQGWPGTTPWNGTSVTSSARPCTHPRRTSPCSRSAPRHWRRRRRTQRNGRTGDRPGHDRRRPAPGPAGP